MSRRFSTVGYPVKDQKDLANEVRLKLAKIRARSRSISMPAPPPSPAGNELKKSKRSSLVPRSSITAMTTSARAKVRSPYTNTNDRPTKYNNNNLPPPPPTNTLEPNNNGNHHYKRRHSTTVRCNNHYQCTNSGLTTKWNEDPTLIKFFDSDSDEDELFLRNKNTSKVKSFQGNRHYVRSQRHADNANKNHNQSLRAEMQEVKARLARLEVSRAPPPPPSQSLSPTAAVTASGNKSATTCETLKGSSLHSPSNSSAFLSPQTSLADSACSVSNKTQGAAHYGKILQDTVLQLGQQLQHEDNHTTLIHSDKNDRDAKNTPFMDTLIALVAETMHINQTLTSLNSQQQDVSSDDLLAVKKSTDNQIKLLTDALQSITTRHQHQLQYQHQATDPLASPPLSHSGSIHNDMEIDDSPKPTKHHVFFSSELSPEASTTTPLLHATHLMHNKQHLPLSTSSTARKRKSNDSTALKKYYNPLKDHEVAPTRDQHTKSVNGILHYPQQQQYQQQCGKEKRQPSSSSVKQKTKSSSERQPLQAFYPMSSSRVNQLLSKYEPLLKPMSASTATATYQHHVEHDRFPSLIDC